MCEIMTTMNGYIIRVGAWCSQPRFHGTNPESICRLCLSHLHSLRCSCIFSRRGWLTYPMYPKLISYMRPASAVDFSSAA